MPDHIQGRVEDRGPRSVVEDRGPRPEPGQGSVSAQLMERRRSILAEAEQIAGRGVEFGRDLTATESLKFDQLIEEARLLQERAGQIEAGEQRGTELQRSFEAVTGKPYNPLAGSGARHPLAYSKESLDALQVAIDSRTAGRFEAGSTEQRAALATTTYGAPRVWGANVLGGPRLLHIAGGMPQQPSDAVLAQLPAFVVPTAQAAVGENASLSEYATVTAGSVTLSRYGRWTDLSRESLVGTDAGSLVSMHVLGVARDLDKVLVTAAESAAGAAIAFVADVPANVRKGIATVLDNTGAADASDLVIVINPADASLLQSVTPTGGQTIAESFQNFSGALVYPTSAATAGFATVCNFRAGARFFEARATATETDVAVKTGTVTVATSVIAGYGIQLAAGFSKVDIVTP